MPNGFLDVPDLKLLDWSRAFGDRINAQPAVYGISVDQAAAFAGLQEAFAAAMQGNLPTIRCTASTSIKNATRAALVAEARVLVNLINGQKTVTDAQKIELGVTVRSMPTPAPTPDQTPRLTIVSVIGWTVRLRLNSATAGRSKPVGVLGATLFSFSGDAPPTDLSQWRFQGNFGRNTIERSFSPTLGPGARVWLTAQWMNTRLQSGPLGRPISTHLQGGTVAMAA